MTITEMPGSSVPPLSDRSANGVTVPAHITLFGFDDVPTEARIEAQSVGWRARRTLLALAVGLIVAPAVFLVPPHAPWALGVLGIGLLTAVRRWAEKHTLHFMEGACPRCREDISISRPIRLHHPHVISCTSCQYESAITVDL